MNLHGGGLMKHDNFVEFEVINSNRLMEIKKFLSEDNILVDIINI